MRSRALGDHGPHPEEKRALGGPISRRAGSVLSAGQHDQGHALLPIAKGGVVDRHPFAVRRMHGDAAFDGWDEQVLEADIPEGPTRHHLVIAASRAEGIELARLHAVLDQVMPGRPIGRDGAGRRDVVGRDGVTQVDQDSGVHDVGDGQPGPG